MGVEPQTLDDSFSLPCGTNFQRGFEKPDELPPLLAEKNSSLFIVK